MTAASASLTEVLRPVKHVLIDFDGPVCSVFAGLPAPEVARRLRAELLRDGAPASLISDGESDPLALLQSIADERPDLVAEADRALTELETKAARVAQPTPGGESLLRACLQSERTVSVVSNNASAAIEAYLADHGLRAYVAGVFGRAAGDPSSMKPNPRLLVEALEAASAKPEECIFIGDSVTDVEAGHAAGMTTIGYANKPGKDAKLTVAGAVIVVDSMEVIAGAMTD